MKPDTHLIGFKAISVFFNEIYASYKKGIKKSWYRLKVLEQVISRVLFPVSVTLYGTMVIHLFPLLLMG